MTEELQRADVQKWIDLLRSGASSERLEGATGLARVAAHTRVRGTVRTRGAITRPAASRLPQGVSLPAALDAFNDEHVEVRRAVAFALGELADESAVTILRRLAETDPEAPVRGDAVDALAKIGGQQAVEALKAAALNDAAAEVRIAAVRALSDLVRAEPSAGREVAETLTHVGEGDVSALVRREAEEALGRTGTG